MNRGIADSPLTPGRALSLSAELSGGELVVVRTAAGQICEFPLGENPYEDWRRCLRNQLKGSGQAGKRSKFRDKADEVAHELARQMDVAELSQQLEAVGQEPATRSNP